VFVISQTGAYQATTGAYSVIVTKPNGKGSRGRPRLRWKYNINIFLRKWERCMGCIDLAKGRNMGRVGVYAGMKFRFP
jgi:hypothetical protein